MERSRPSISRREFAALTAATAGALLGTGTADSRPVSATEPTDLYEFLLGHVEEEYAIPTLLTFDDESGFDALDDLSLDYRSHRDGTLAAHAELVPEHARAVIDADATERAEYAPGANPFWKLEDYDDGVFPDPEDSVDFIGYDEALAGVEYLEQQHEERLNVRTVGTGAGRENEYEGTTDPQDVWLLELTENVGDEEAFAEKDKLVFTMSIHGDERAGTEAGLRFVEELLSGERPETEELLSEFVLVFVSPNPGGWVVRNPVYEEPAEPPDFRRFNAAGYDLNRQFPNVGWIHSEYVPAEPDGRDLVDDQPGEVDGDVPETVSEQVPDTLAVVEQLRSYGNVEYVVDLHGMYAHTTAIISVTSAGETPLDKVDSELLNRAFESELESSLGSVDDWEAAFDAAVADYENQETCEAGGFCFRPDGLFAYGTKIDTIGYTAPGFLDVWASLPEEDGGLGATSVTLEIAFSNSFPEDMKVSFLPEMTQFHVEAYQTAIRTTVEHATREVDAAVATGERSTAYVRSETLTRSSADLPHTEGSSAAALDGGSGPSATVEPEARVFSGSPAIEDWVVRQRTDPDAADPAEVFGYQQRDYEVTPLAAFETLAEYADAPVESVDLEDVRAGDLLTDGDPAYDNLVICHDDGDDAYVSAVSDYVESGGNLVLTDAGLSVTVGLDLPCLEDVDERAVHQTEIDVPEYAAEDNTHPLLADRKEFDEGSGMLTREPWSYPILGYQGGESPTYVIGESSFGSDVDIGFSHNSLVRLATAPVWNDRVGVHLLGSLLPPATQENLHPFGLADHALTLFGYQLLCNALGYQIECSLDGEQVATFGSTVDVDLEAEPNLKTSSTPEETPTPGESPTASEGTPTSTPSPTPESTSTQAETPTANGADDGGPGFGPVAALAGLGGASYLLGRHDKDDEPE